MKAVSLARLTGYFVAILLIVTIVTMQSRSGTDINLKGSVGQCSSMGGAVDDCDDDSDCPELFLVQKLRLRNV